MSDIRFDTPENEFGRPPQREQGGDFADKFVTWGLVSSREQAMYILIGIAVVALIAAFFFIRGGGSDAPPLLPQ